MPKDNIEPNAYDSDIHSIEGAITWMDQNRRKILAPEFAYHLALQFTDDVVVLDINESNHSDRYEEEVVLNIKEYGRKGMESIGIGASDLSTELVRKLTDRDVPKSMMRGNGSRADDLTEKSCEILAEEVEH